MLPKKDDNYQSVGNVNMKKIPVSIDNESKCYFADLIQYLTYVIDDLQKAAWPPHRTTTIY